MKVEQRNTPTAVGSNATLGPLPEPAGFRMRYRSEPGMIGHYHWTYADQRRRKYDSPECEYEDLFTAEQLRSAVDAERERCAQVCEQQICACCWDDDAQAAAEHLAAEIRKGPNAALTGAEGRSPKASG